MCGLCGCVYISLTIFFVWDCDVAKGYNFRCMHAYVCTLILDVNINQCFLVPLFVMEFMHV